MPTAGTDNSAIINIYNFRIQEHNATDAERNCGSNNRSNIPGDR